MSQLPPPVPPPAGAEPPPVTGTATQKKPPSPALIATAVIVGLFVVCGVFGILIGDDAYALDSLVRDHPEDAYDEDFREKMMEQRALNTLVGEGLFEP